MCVHHIEIQREVHLRRNVRVTDQRRIEEILAFLESGEETEYFVLPPQSSEDTITFLDEQGRALRTIRVLAEGVRADGEKYYALEPSAYRAVINALLG